MIKPCILQVTKIINGPKKAALIPSALFGGEI